MSLTRLRKMGRKIESVEGTPETLGATDYAGNFKGPPTLTRSPNQYERELQRGDLSSDGTLPGQRMATMSMPEEELVGGAADTAAPWHTDLRAMGFSSSALQMIEISTIALADIERGDRIGNNATEGSATATGIVVAFIDSTATPDTVGEIGEDGKLVYLPVTGTLASTDTLHSYASTQATADIDTNPVAAGFRFQPFSENASGAPPSVTPAFRYVEAGQWYEERLGGARAQGSLSLRMGEPALLQCEYIGAPIMSKSGGVFIPSSVSALTGIPTYPSPPKVAKGMPLRLKEAGASDHTPILTEVTIDFGIELTPRPTITDADIGDTGYMATRITDRNIRISMDPEKVAPGTMNYWDKVYQARFFEFYTSLGIPSDANGMLIIDAPQCQLQSDLSEDERDKIDTFSLEAGCTRGDNGDDELFIDHVFVA
ncbi:MAG: hypothetical protein NCW75_05545 [Phycisphaera sp.]|nr:MAG: hypothetical protein NCW75_05545 [Phycisphaera sp.]